MMICSACGEEADEEHFVSVETNKGIRKKCPVKNRFAHLIDKEEKEEREGGKEREKEREKEEKKNIEEVHIEPPVYKPMDPRDIMLEVIQSPVLKLNKNQIAELLDIADDYGGVLSPVMLKRLVSNFEGVTDKKADFIAERYSIKLEKARDRLSIADAKRLGLDLISKSERDQRGDDIDLEAKIARGISEGLRGLEHRFNMNNDIFAKPIEKILSNAADATGITSRIMNWFFTGIEEQIRRDPYLIGDARDFIPQLPRLISGNQGDREEEEKGEERERKEITAGMSKERRIGSSFEEERRKNRRKTGGIFAELDEYFEEGEEEGEEK